MNRVQLDKLTPPLLEDRPPTQPCMVFVGGAGASMTDIVAEDLRADLAREVQIWMNDAFAKVDFDAAPDRVVESLTLAWSDVVLRIEAVEQGGCSGAPPCPGVPSALSSEMKSRPRAALLDPVG